METTTPHRSGYVSIIGKPNAGKSSLINALLGERISIITHKAQTTRHRIKGILSGDDYQIVFSDTPGTIVPSHKLHEKMMNFVKESYEDADVFVYMIDAVAPWEPDEYSEKVFASKVPTIVVLNKVDQLTQEQTQEMLDIIKTTLGANYVVPLSVLSKFNITALLDLVKSLLPEGPAYFDKDQLTDKSERFIAAEIIREKILLQYQEEVPYTVEVGIVSFKDEPGILRIEAEIYIIRESQKPIIIGKGGERLKRLGTASRLEMEKFFGKKIFLKTFVKVKENWRENDRMLKEFGYMDK